MDRFPHYLRPLGITRLPQRHLFIDTEARAEPNHGVWEQRWACAAGEAWTWRRRGVWEQADQVASTERHEFWAWLLRHVEAPGRTVVWAHNLAYDLRITGALRELPAAGYRLQGIVLERTASWASFAGESGQVVFVDLAAWLPTSLQVIARELGLGKQSGPAAGATDGHLLARCEQDVETLRTAALRLLGALREWDAGPFRPTAAGQSHAIYRRRFLSAAPLVHDQADALAAERLGMHTGRCEAWQHGRLNDGPYYEYDLRLAYAHIARDCQLPMSIIGRTWPESIAKFRAQAERYAILSVVTITTDEPIAPAPHLDRTVWPVGRFKTTLWEPELLQVIDSGAQVEWEHAWLYRRGPVLALFASWVLEQLHPEHGEQDPIRRRLLKHWSRTLVGRMALRYRRWEAWGEAAEHDLRLGVLVDLETKNVTELLHVGADLLELAELAEAESSLPQVTGWVMSEARRRLWELMAPLGCCHLAYVDTDALIVDRRGAAQLDRRIDSGNAWTLTPKGEYRSLDIRGPRNLDVEHVARIAGVPKKATRVGRLEFDGEVWRSLKESIARSELEHVTTTPRRFVADAPDPRRHHLDDGRTEPIRLDLEG